jgi:hypothetical protein
MIEFELDGREYRFEKPSAMVQLHLTRKISTLLPALAPLISEIAKAINENKSAEDWLEVAALAQPFTDALSAMKNEDAEYVFGECLSVIRIKHQGNWIAFWSGPAKGSMIAELNDPSLLLRLTVRVLKESLANFTRGFLTSAREPQAA